MNNLNNLSSRPTWRDLIPQWCYSRFSGVRFLGSARNDKKFSILKSQVSSRRGFTLIELIIYMGLLAALMTMLATLFASIIDVQLDTKATSSVDQDSRYIIAKLHADMDAATSIAAPQLGSQSATLQLVVNSQTQTYSMDAGSNFQITRGSQSDNLNSVNTNVSNLSFRRLGSGDTYDTIQVQFTLTSEITRSANKRETKTFKTTIGRQ